MHKFCQLERWDHTSQQGCGPFRRLGKPHQSVPLDAPCRVADPRLRGRDDKPYGPLPGDWAHFEGTYLYSNKVVIAYTIGDASVLELPGPERDVGDDEVGS